VARSLSGLGVGLGLLVGACGPSSPASTGSSRDASTPSMPSMPGDASSTIEASDASLEDATEAPSSDAGDAADETSPYPADRFITGVVSFDPGECAGFGASSMPGIVEGPPHGGGSSQGSTDVVSLGGGGSIVVSFAPNAIVDGPGPDFIVFENPFWAGGSSSDVYAEPGEVSVSDDGVTWTTFPCMPTPGANPPLNTGVLPPYGTCAGWHVVWSTPTNGISPFDPATAGGDAFDLSTIGVTHARYVRIVDETHESCPEAGARPTSNGFDLDAIAIVNAEQP
jgi:hypothetical protein